MSESIFEYCLGKIVSDEIMAGGDDFGTQEEELQTGQLARKDVSACRRGDSVGNISEGPHPRKRKEEKCIQSHKILLM